MTPTTVLLGQLLLACAITVFGVGFATEWTAAQLGFQARLGAPWFIFHGWPIYYPWRFFEWWYAFEAYAPRIFNLAGLMAASSGLVAALCAMACSVWLARQSQRVTRILTT